MVEVSERSPYGPWVDYSRTLSCAEDAVGVIIDQILTDGGSFLWQKYLERKAFPFAANAVTDAVVSQLKMCFVAHDEGEGIDGLGEDWELDDEPEPGEIDSWARMHVPVRRLNADKDSTATSSASRNARKAEEVRRLANLKARTSDKGGKLGKAGGKTETVVSRSSPIQMDYAFDEEEERLRDQKSQEEARKKDKEKKGKEAEKAKDEERKKVQVMHEEMARRLHTFDCDGNIIWVEEPKVDKLPKAQEVFPYSVKKDPRQKANDLDSTAKSAKEPSSPANTKGRSGRTGGRGNTRTEQKEFTDDFCKLQYGQPPITETMSMQSGVILEALGKRLAGVDQSGNPERQMSRKEYVQLAERELASEGQFRGGSTMEGGKTPTNLAAGGGDGEGAEGEPNLDASAMPGAIGLAAAQAGAMPSGGGALSGTLPPLNGTKRGLGGTQGKKGGGGGGPNAPNAPGPTQMAPPAPNPSTRAYKKFAAVGHLPVPPRYHAPSLGGPSGFGSAQPPLGATMGHGLMRHGSVDESYFFPPKDPSFVLPLPLLRSASDTGLGSGRRAQLTPKLSGRTTPTGLAKPSSQQGSRHQMSKGPEMDDGAEDDGYHGKMKPEMSPAYRTFRHMIAPTV